MDFINRHTHIQSYLLNTQNTVLSLKISNIFLVKIKRFEGDVSAKQITIIIVKILIIIITKTLLLPQGPFVCASHEQTITTDVVQTLW